jgi:hypothetical protein
LLCIWARAQYLSHFLRSSFSLYPTDRHE